MSQKLTASIARIKGETLEGMVSEDIIDQADEHLLFIKGERSAIDIALHRLHVHCYQDIKQSAEDKLATATKVAQSLDLMIRKAIVHKRMSTKHGRVRLPQAIRGEASHAIRVVATKLR